MKQGGQLSVVGGQLSNALGGVSQIPTPDKQLTTDN